MPAHAQARNLAAAAILAGWISLIALGFVSRLQFGLEDDELQHLHMAWRIGQGEVAYRDFFELHPPLWHLAMAPLIRGYRTFAELPYVRLRALHAGSIGLIVIVAYIVLRRIMPPAPAAWTAGLFLIGSAFSVGWYDVRPDWLALLCLLVAAGLLSSGDEARSSGRGMLARFALGGVLVGIASGMTQKSWFLLVAFVIWTIASAIAAPAPGERRARARRAGAFLGGVVASGAALLGYFALRGGVEQLIRDTFLLQLHAPREKWFFGYFRASALPAAGLMALALLALVTIARRWRDHLAAAGTLGLLATLALFGFLAYLLTPVPWEQSYLFFVCFWSSLLAGWFLWMLVSDPRRGNRPMFIAIAVIVLLLAAIQKTWPDRAIVSGSWFTALIVAALALRKYPALAMLSASAIGLFFVVRADLRTLRYEDRRERQAKMYEAIESRLGPDEPIIALWPPGLPFRRHAGTFPFAHWTILEGFGKQVQSEYLSAIQSGQVRVVVGYRPDQFAQFLPEFDAVIRKEFRRLDELPRVLEYCDTYERQDNERR